MKISEITLYVSDQATSRHFYERALREKPVLDVPGMTEFMLTNDFKLGLMPEKGIVKITTSFMISRRRAKGYPLRAISDCRRSFQVIGVRGS